MLFLKLQSVLEGRLISSQFTADQEWWRFHNVQNPHLDTVRSSLFDHRLDGGLREFGIINRQQNSHDSPRSARRHASDSQRSGRNLTSSTEHGAACITAVATLPNKKRFTVVRSEERRVGKECRCQ